ncbi:EH domain-containing and endocytosis protein 1 [Nakaseomyces glabratus]|nr:EH domain-containing and endocytosis protein 1 [Nakaseomyces glabratus]KTB22618.1 EH domain-containing and endocytosis protein 1 [Nakaseomyces glabratus]
MAAIVFQTPLTHEESDFYSQKFRQLDSEELGVVTGEAVKPLFAASGLSSQILSQIWALVDIDNKGFLNQNEFNAAMRLIAQMQQFPGQSVTTTLYDHPPSRLPILSDPNTVQSTGNSRMGSTSNASIPHISANDISKYSQLFDRSAGASPTIPGDKAKDIFLKARLPNQTLGEIWALCDRDASGTLTKQEFIMAMYLIQLVMSNHPSTQPLPDHISNEIWDSLNQLPATSLPMEQPLSASSTGLSSNPPLVRQNTLSRVSSGAFTNAANNWFLTPEKKAQFDAIFDALDKNHAGALGSQILVPFFLSSKLSQETLASVWDLADIHNNAEFTKLEFAIAMFLIQKKNSGIDLPDVIPNELLHSPSLGLYPSQAPQTQANAQPPLPPSRNTKPQMNLPVQPQHSNNGSLNDLMALNGSFSPQPTTAKPLNHTDSGNSFENSSVANTMTAKKFNPSSTFGQSIIKEEDERNVALASNTATMGTTTPVTTASNLPAVPTMSNVPGTNNTQAPPATQTQHMNKATSPVQRQSTLPKVPNFGGFTNAAGSGINAITGATGAVLGGAIGAVAGAATGTVSGAISGANRDIFADGESSRQLSTATTDLANLSNQANSLSNQAGIASEKKSKVSQELQRVNEMKANIESKLATLRAKYDQDVKATEEMETQLTQTNREVETLNQQLGVVEANYHATDSKLNELKTQYEEAQQKNSKLKEDIANFNTMIASMEAQLNEKKQVAKQELSVVDVNMKQLELNQITVAGIEKEISGLDEQVNVYVNKRKELDEYKKTIEDQHAQLQAKYQEISDKNNELTERQNELDERNQQIEEQEKLYHEHVAKLQSLFDDLTNRQQQFEKAEQELKNRHVEYAQKVQDLTERQMNLAMGEIPSDAKEIVEKHKQSSGMGAGAAMGIAGAAGAAVATAGAAIAHAMTSNKDDDEKTESDVFDRDVPTVGSQSEPDENAETTNHRSEAEAVNMADRFEGDLNEYGIPRTQSLTSSVANNAPQSVRDDVELPETLEEKEMSKPSTAGNTITPNAHMPGEWDNTGANTMTNTQEDSGQMNDSPADQSQEHSESDTSIQKSLDQEVPKKKMTIDEEFPPIQELNIDESDSSSDGEFEDTRELPTQVSKNVDDQSMAMTAPPNGVTPSVPQMENTPKDDFDDAFNGLEKATEEDGNTSDFENLANQGSFEGFEHIDRNEVAASMQQGNVVGAPTQQGQPMAPQGHHNHGNDEWDEIFAGFGNGVKEPNASQQMQQPIPASTSATAQAPINRGIATTPKSLAVEELMGMGFKEDEAVKALEKSNWDLETATNLLLDAA